MADENSIRKAKALYEAKLYDDALSMCVALIKENIDTNEAWILSAKIWLRSMKTPTDSERVKIFIQSFEMACVGRESLEEICKISSDLQQEYYQWKADCIKSQLIKLRTTPALTEVQQYIAFPAAFAIMEFAMSQAESKAFNIYCEKNGIEREELNEKLKNEPFVSLLNVSEVIQDEEVNTLEYATAKEIFNNTKSKLSGNNNGTPNFIIQVCRIIVDELAVSSSLVVCILNHKEINSDMRIKCLLLKSEILSYQLTTCVYPNGMTLSLYSGEEQRRDFVEELKKVYVEIKDLDPSLELPPIPNVEPIIPPQARQASNRSTSNDGGCYVATAVYGSYDCPEVWTLRRFRDHALAATWYGRVFIRVYYAITPTLVKWFGGTGWFKNMWKPVLDKMVEKLNDNGVENTAYRDREW